MYGTQIFSRSSFSFPLRLPRESSRVNGTISAVFAYRHRHSPSCTATEKITVECDPNAEEKNFISASSSVPPETFTLRATAASAFHLENHQNETSGRTFGTHQAIPQVPISFFPRGAVKWRYCAPSCSPFYSSLRLQPSGRRISGDTLLPRRVLPFTASKARTGIKEGTDRHEDGLKRMMQAGTLIPTTKKKIKNIKRRSIDNAFLSPTLFLRRKKDSHKRRSPKRFSSLLLLKRKEAQKLKNRKNEPKEKIIETDDKELHVHCSSPLCKESFSHSSTASPILQMLSHVVQYQQAVHALQHTPSPFSLSSFSSSVTTTTDSSSTFFRSSSPHSSFSSLPKGVRLPFFFPFHTAALSFTIRQFLWALLYFRRRSSSHATTLLSTSPYPPPSASSTTTTDTTSSPFFPRSSDTFTISELYETMQWMASTDVDTAFPPDVGVPSSNGSVFRTPNATRTTRPPPPPPLHAASFPIPSPLGVSLSRVWCCHLLLSFCPTLVYMSPTSYAALTELVGMRDALFPSDAWEGVESEWRVAGQEEAEHNVVEEVGGTPPPPPRDERVRPKCPCTTHRMISSPSLRWIAKLVECTTFSLQPWVCAEEVLEGLLTDLLQEEKHDDENKATTRKGASFSCLPSTVSPNGASCKTMPAIPLSRMTTASSRRADVVVPHHHRSSNRNKREVFPFPSVFTPLSAIAFALRRRGDWESFDALTTAWLHYHRLARSLHRPLSSSSSSSSSSSLVLGADKSPLSLQWKEDPSGQEELVRASCPCSIPSDSARSCHTTSSSFPLVDSFACPSPSFWGSFPFALLGSPSHCHRLALASSVTHLLTGFVAWLIPTFFIPTSSISPAYYNRAWNTYVTYQQQQLARKTGGEEDRCGPLSTTLSTHAPMVTTMDTLSSVFRTSSSDSVFSSCVGDFACSHHVSVLLRLLAVEVPTWEALWKHPVFLSVVECSWETTPFSLPFSLSVFPAQSAPSDSPTPPFSPCGLHLAVPCVRLHPFFLHSHNGKANIYFSSSSSLPSRTRAAPSTAVASPFFSFSASPTSVSSPKEGAAVRSSHERRGVVVGRMAEDVPESSTPRTDRPREDETRNECMRRQRAKKTWTCSNDNDVSNAVWSERHNDDLDRRFALAPGHERQERRSEWWGGHHAHRMNAPPTVATAPRAIYRDGVLDSTHRSILYPVREHKNGFETIPVKEVHPTTSAPLPNPADENQPRTNGPLRANDEEEEEFLALLLTGGPKQPSESLGPSSASSLADTTGETKEKGNADLSQEKPVRSPFLLSTDTRDAECLANDKDDCISPTGQVFQENSKKKQRRFRPSWQHDHSRRSSFSTGSFTSSQKKYERSSHLSAEENLFHPHLTEKTVMQ